MFYTIKVVKKIDDTIARDCRSFDNIDEAKVRFHTDLSKEINETVNKYVMCDILNEEGCVLHNECWYKETEE